MSTFLIIGSVEWTQTLNKADLLSRQVRKRDENFPVRSEQQYEFLQPSSRVHIGKILQQRAEEMLLTYDA